MNTSITHRLKVAIKGMLIFIPLLFSLTSHANVVCQSGGSCTQTITLTPGWNAIYVQVAPDEVNTENVFASLIGEDTSQINSVWHWLSHRAQIDYVQTPDVDKLLSQPGWLRYFPPSSDKTFLNNLFAIQANNAYLVNISGSNNVTLTISGSPVIPKLDWQSNTFNLVGFHVDPLNKPTFSDFFSSSVAHNEQSVYRLINDTWEVINADNTLVEPGIAYWVFSKQGSDFTGPIAIELPQINRLEYGTILERLTAQFKNRKSTSQSIDLQIIGEVEGLHYANPDVSSSQSWLSLSGTYNKNLNSEEVYALPLGVRRADFTPQDFIQTLEVKSSGGSRWLIPVSASAPQLNSLWVGSVTIERVSEIHNYQHNCEIAAHTQISSEIINGVATQIETEIPAQTNALCIDEETGLPIAKDDEVALTPVADEFTFRIIMHREGTQVRLLKDVIQMRELNADGTVGKYVLLTDESLIANYTGVTLRNGQSVGRRISTMAYDFEGDTKNMTGTLDSELTVTFTLAADSPTNPFRHHYHAQHNDDGYEITRTLKFTFNTVSSGLSAGYDYKGGTYVETLIGLHKHPIITAGTFTLRHAAQINTLNQ